jgi:predicted GNAT family N-acyltransferase
LYFVFLFFYDEQEMVIVEKISSDGILQEAFNIRKLVFVQEQNVDEKEEYEFEEDSHHYIAKIDDQFVGTARWRVTDKGVKLERFAVLKNYRSRGVGSALLSTMLKEIPHNDMIIYLHAQVTAIGLYKKFGFVETGNLFEEANIQHYKMILQK